MLPALNDLVNTLRQRGSDVAAALDTQRPLSWPGCCQGVWPSALVLAWSGFLLKLGFVIWPYAVRLEGFTVPGGQLVRRA